MESLGSGIVLVLVTARHHLPLGLHGVLLLLLQVVVHVSVAVPRLVQRVTTIMPVLVRDEARGQLLVVLAALGVSWFEWWLDRRKLLEGNLDVVVIENFLELSDLLFFNLVLGCAIDLVLDGFIRSQDGLISGVDYVDGLIRSELGPVVSFFVVEKVIDI